jgi:Tol biopolymer transport system component
MTPERWHQVTAIFHAARTRTAAERDQFLAEVCGDDASLRQDVDALLAGDAGAGSFGDTPLFAPAPVLEPGALFGAYRIERLIGSGGMGRIYRARDTTLGRDVAIKVLPDGFLADPMRVERLQREARVLAALNHPNIATIYGLEEVNGVLGLVLELIDGPTLADRIARGPMPLGESLVIVQQIAEGLAAAHERGIVHRDVKPSNIALSHGGVVKVLDFGLAKTTAVEGLGGSGAHAPTPAPLTREGLIVGTVAYMSPEQARGQVVDRQTDVWAFGCVLFEMLTGRQPFGAETPTDALAAILEREPPWERLPSATPPSVHRLLRRCLAKDPKQRVRDLGDARLDLDEAGVDPTPVPALERRSRRVRLARLVAAALGVAVAVMFAAWYLRGRDLGETPDMRPIRFLVPDSREVVPQGGVPMLSPDGRRLAFVARRNGVPTVWVRPLDSLESRALLDTENAFGFPTWSPDSRSIAIYSLRYGMRMVDQMSGEVRTLGRAKGGASYGSAWTPDGRLVGGSLFRGMFAVSVSGESPPSQVTQFDVAHGEGGHLFPTILPDGRHFLYLSEPSNTIWLASFDSHESIRLLRADSQALYAPPGYLLFVRRQTVFAQPFDATDLKLSGKPEPIVEGVLSEQVYGADFTASSNGVLAYRAGNLHALTQLTWVDRAGKRLGTVGPASRYANIELSPDGTRVALELLDATSYTKDIWVMELGRGVLTRLTFDSANETFPIWSPDGKWIMFASDRDDGWWQLYRHRADGAGGDERVAATANAIVPQSWAPDGQSVVYLIRPDNLGVLHLMGAPNPHVFDPAVYEGGINDGYGQISPDGHWLAYGTAGAAGFNIYVQSYPQPGAGKWQVSKSGGFAPRWRRDGRELFYYSLDGWIMGVPVIHTTPLEFGTAVPLFKANLLGAIPAIPWRIQYDVSPDGQRFLLNELVEDPYANAPITVVTNWMTLLRK